MLFLILLLCAVFFGGKAALATAGVIIGCSLIYYVLYAIATYKLFVKSNRPGWWGFIPVLNRYQIYKMSWSTTMFWVALLFVAVGAYLGKADQSSTIVSILAIVVSIANIVIELMYNVKLSKSFGKGVAFGIILVLFPVFGTMILGLGKSEYIGPQA